MGSNGENEEIEIIRCLRLREKVVTESKPDIEGERDRERFREIQ